jgi:hypothetical protein
LAFTLLESLEGLATTLGRGICRAAENPRADRRQAFLFISYAVTLFTSKQFRRILSLQLQKNYKIFGG